MSRVCTEVSGHVTTRASSKLILGLENGVSKKLWAEATGGKSKQVHLITDDGFRDKGIYVIESLKYISAIYPSIYNFSSHRIMD